MKVWDGPGCADICMSIVDLEEGRRSGLDPSLQNSGVEVVKKTIPEWDRFKLTGMDCWSHEKKICAEFTSVLPVKMGEREVLQKTFNFRTLQAERSGSLNTVSP